VHKPSFCLVRIACATALIALTPGMTAGQTLRDALRGQSVLAAENSLPNLDKAITSYQVLNDAKNFLIAYYVDTGSDALYAPLVISRFDKASHAWQTKEVSSGAIQDDTCLGSAIGAESVRDRIYVELHINPSASCMLVLSRDLAVEKVLSGWFLAAFDDGRIVYHGNEVHFGPVHAAELSIFDPRTNQERKIYPKKPFQEIRAAHIEGIRAFFDRDPDWCNVHNHSCDPEWFDNELEGKVAVSDKTDSLAFVVRFDNTNFWTDADRARLEAFRETRNYPKLHPGGPPDGVLPYFFADLGRMGRLRQKQAVLDLFPEGSELRDFVAAAFDAKEAASGFENFSAKFGFRWANEPLRKQFLRAIEVPPEFTEVLYVYRNLSHPDAVEYRELLLDDWKSRFADAPTAKALEADVLRQLFEH
jgi:hypothetical protein